MVSGLLFFRASQTEQCRISELKRAIERELEAEGKLSMTHRMKADEKCGIYSKCMSD